MLSKDIFCAIFLIFIFVQNIPRGSALNCYYCEELTGRQCDLNVRKILTEACTSSFVCAKYIWTDNGTSTIHRRCAPHTICQEQNLLVTANLTLNYCNTCNSSLCNAAETVSYSLASKFTVIIILVQILLFN